jgi:hypothetical protein
MGNPQAAEEYCNTFYNPSVEDDKNIYLLYLRVCLGKLDDHLRDSFAEQSGSGSLLLDGGDEKSGSKKPNRLSEASVQSAVDLLIKYHDRIDPAQVRVRALAPPRVGNLEMFYETLLTEHVFFFLKVLY